jgi:hypothetical protein
MQIVKWIGDNIVLVTVIQQGLFAALSAIFQLLGWVVASKWCGTLSTLDLGRIVRYFTAQTDAAKLDQKMAKVEQAVGKDALLKNTLGVLFVALILSGCAGTFEEAKLVGAKARQSAPPTTASSPERCQSLSERQYWFTGTGLTLTAAGVAIASLALPVKTDTSETILLVSGGVTSVGGLGLTGLGNAAGVNYTKEECGK